MKRKDEIKTAYKTLGKAHCFYDGMITGASFPGRLIMKYIWRMTKEENMEYIIKSFEMIPSDFSGKLLEVPVGTGALSMPVWQTLPDADITCLDYSENMMSSAMKRAKDMGIENIRFKQGDVGDLPYADESFDCVISLNGFHAFPDKDMAYRETYRVLKQGGMFCGCFYVEGCNPHTDKWIKGFYVKRGFFTPPFETVKSLETRLKTMYKDVAISNVQSIVNFHCIK